MSILQTGDTEFTRTAIDLAILVAKEILLLPSLSFNLLMLVVPLLKQIWDQYNLFMRENPRLCVYVGLVLNNVPQSLDNPQLAELITSIFPHIAGTLPTNHRETIVRTLAEKIRFQIVYINQPAPYHQQHDNAHLQFENTFTSLVQTLRALSIVFTDPSMKAQCLHDNHQLLTSLVEMSRTLTEDTSDPEINVAPAYRLGTSLISRPQAQEFLKLVSVLSG